MSGLDWAVLSAVVICLYAGMLWHLVTTVGRQ